MIEDAASFEDDDEFDETRKTVAELATLYEVEPEINEVIVEGSLDKHLVHWFLKRAGFDDVVVYQVRERVRITKSELTKRKQTTGVRGELISAALFITEKVKDAEAVTSVTFIADRDWDWLQKEDPLPESPLLLYTDHSAIELYGWSEDALEKLVRIALECPAAVTGRSTRLHLEQLLISIFLARWALHNSKLGIGFPEKFEAHCDVPGGAFDAKGLFVSLGGNVSKQVAALLAEIKKSESALPSDSRRAIHGHDIAKILFKYLKPFVAKEKKKDFQNWRQLEKMWLMGIEHADLKESGLFTELSRRLAS